MSETASLAIILRARDESAKTLKEAEGNLNGIGMAAAKLGVVGVAALGATAVAAVKLAGDFQYTTQTLVTGAGEDQQNLKLIREGILGLAGEVGQTPQHLAEGMYMIESAGKHGQEALDILAVSAKTATVGHASLAAVSDTLTSALNAYHMPTSQAAHVTDILLATVAAGKMHMSDLAENIGKVMPVANLTGVSLAELSAAVATMTMQGTDAAVATTSLRFLMTNLAAPSKAAASAMAGVGLSAEKVALMMHEHGLQATLEMVTDQLGKKFPGSAADFAKAMAHVKDGTMSADEAMESLKTSSPQAFAALDKIVGGTRGLVGALELTGPNMAMFKKNINDISHASDGAGKTQEGWAEHSRDFNVVLERLNAGLQAMLIRIGNELLPVLTALGLWFIAHLPQIQAFAMQGIARVKEVIQDSVPYIHALQVALGFVADHFNVIGPVLAGIVITWGLWNLGLALTAGFRMAVLAIQFVSGLMAIASASGVVTAATWAWNLAMSANPIGVVLIVIALLIAAIILVITHTKEITKAWNQFSAEARKEWGIISAEVSAFINVIINYIKSLNSDIAAIWNSLMSTAEHAWHEFTSRPIFWIVFLLASAFMHLNSLRAFIENAFNAMVIHAAQAGMLLTSRFIGWVSGLPGQVWGILSNAAGSVQNFANSVPGTASAAGQGIWNGIVNSITALPGEVGGIFNGVVGAVERAIGAAGDAGWRLGQNIISSVVRALSGLPGAIAGAVGNAISNIGGQVTGGLHAAGVPGFASGGIVTARPGGMLARIGEGGEDEVVATASQLMRAGALMGGGGGDGTYVIQLHVDGRKMAETVFRHGGQQFRLQGGGLGSGAG